MSVRKADLMHNLPAVLDRLKRTKQAEEITHFNKPTCLWIVYREPRGKEGCRRRKARV
ncbi:MAG: hypothetical protein HYR88_01145 [Verrucomicrobia bacterium]|nr:hypothetical protein [Verrucomicrobiota bacterium]MBI3868829.1 hypothetical protein [Verrucomicrobiota bacterium]